MIVTDFYRNCEIFVTGGSGAVGKALIEKLLRSCNVKRIYILLRPKKDMTAEQRLDKLRKAKIFRYLKTINPEALNKLTAIPGDAVLPNLGITTEYAKILENVSCIFHCAATVRFDEPLKIALKVNVAGTLEALKFAMTLKDLKLFLHVSTFYSNPYLKYVDSKLYSSPMDWRICLKLMESDYNEDMLNALTKKMITGFPNTYTFTKNLAETLVNEYRDRLPVTIFKPSIVLFALNDPEPGFPPSITGAMGLFALAGAGILKTVYIHDDVRLDLTPQDWGINTMLYYGTRSAEIYEKGVPDEAPVNMCSSTQNTFHSFKHFGESLEKEKVWEELAFEKNFLLPSVIYTSNRLYYKYLVFTKEVLPALLVDFILILLGRKPVLMGIVRKAYTTLQVLQPFMFNNYDSPGFSYINEMHKEFRGTEFDLEVELNSAIDQQGIQRQIRKMVSKVREILLNEDPSSLPKARRILKIKKFFYNLVRGIFYFFVLRWLYRALMGYVNDNSM